MTAQITEVHQGLGSWEIPFRVDAAILGEDLNFYEHVIVYEGETRTFVGVVLKLPIVGRGTSIAGASVRWWLGLNSDGAVIDEREYLSGNDKLSNGDFADGNVYWVVDQDPLWSIAGGVATIVGSPVGDEPLTSDESFECKPGQLATAVVRAKRTTGTVGRLRNRVVFDGRFRYPNLLAGATWTDESFEPGDASVVADVLVLGPTTIRQSVINGDFEDDFTMWDVDDPTVWEIADTGTIGDLGIRPPGTKCGRIHNTFGGSRYLRYATYIDVTPGERIFLQGYFSPWGQDLTTHADGYFAIGAACVDGTGGDAIHFATDTVGLDDVTSPMWAVMSQEFTVPDGHPALAPQVEAGNVTVGAWAFDQIIVSHLENNTAVLRTSGAVTVQPGRTYRLLAKVTTDIEVKSGSLKAEVTFFGPDSRPVIVVESPAMTPTLGAEKLFSFDFTPPSGYDTAQLRTIVTDTLGGSWRIPASSISVTDTDTATKWYDEVSPATLADFGDVAQDVTVPDGAARCHVAVIAEDQAAGWVVDAVDLHRRGTLANAEDLVADALIHPETGQRLLSAGNIHPAGRIAFDELVRNVTNADLLTKVSSGSLVSPTREWRITPEPALDWGLPEEIFTDRSDVVLQDGDLVLRGAPAAMSDATNRLTKVKTIGADRTPVGGQKLIITGEADVAPGPTDRDWFNNPVARTRIISDSSSETRSNATDRAEVELENIDTPATQTKFSIADWAAVGQFDVGDWIYVYSPLGGLVDKTNPVEVKGRAIYPKRSRCIERTRKLGPGRFRVYLRRPDGSEREITQYIDWEKETSADITVGDVIPDFVTDPQGGAAGVQFRRYRASTGR